MLSRVGLPLSHLPCGAIAMSLSDLCTQYQAQEQRQLRRWLLWAVVGSVGVHGVALGLMRGTSATSAELEPAMIQLLVMEPLPEPSLAEADLGAVSQSGGTDGTGGAAGLPSSGNAVVALSTGGPAGSEAAPAVPASSTPAAPTSTADADESAEPETAIAPRAEAANSEPDPSAPEPITPETPNPEPEVPEPTEVEATELETTEPEPTEVETAPNDEAVAVDEPSLDPAPPQNAALEAEAQTALLERWRDRLQALRSRNANPEAATASPAAEDGASADLSADNPAEQSAAVSTPRPLGGTQAADGSGHSGVAAVGRSGGRASSSPRTGLGAGSGSADGIESGSGSAQGQGTGGNSSPTSGSGSSGQTNQGTGQGRRQVACLSCVEPSYPRSALEARVEGQPRVQVEINPDGSVRRVTLTRSSGNAAIDQAVVDAAQRSRFQPVAGGASIPMEYDLTIDGSQRNQDARRRGEQRSVELPPEPAAPATVPTSDSQTSDSQTSEAPAPESQASESQTPESQTPEPQTSEPSATQTPESLAPEPPPERPAVPPPADPPAPEPAPAVPSREAEAAPALPTPAPPSVSPAPATPAPAAPAEPPPLPSAPVEAGAEPAASE